MRSRVRRVMLWDNDAVKRVVTLAAIIVGGLVISSCSGSPEGIPVSSATLDSYRTPPGTGILCDGPGYYDFLTFAIAKAIVSGHIVETDVSTRAELPMTGAYNGRTVTLLPLSGFGAFKATLNGHSLQFSTVSGVVPSEPIKCSVSSLAEWRTTAAHAPHFTSRQLSTPEFLAMTDLIFASTGAGEYPLVTPASDLIQRLSARENPVVQGNATWGGSATGDVAPAPYLSFTTGPVTLPHDVSVSISTSGYVLTVATRAADGSCWYDVSSEGGRMYLSTAPGVIESSCSAGNLVQRLVKYEGP
jgi:hypothetical protein